MIAYFKITDNVAKNYNKFIPCLSIGTGNFSIGQDWH